MFFYYWCQEVIIFLWQNKNYLLYIWIIGQELKHSQHLLILEFDQLQQRKAFFLTNLFYFDIIILP